MRSLCIASFVALSFACVLPSLASAQTDDVDRRAQAHFHAATAYFEEGDYERASIEFRAAYEASPHPELLFNIYMCEERLARLELAIDALEQYLASGATIENRTSLEARLGHLRERAAQGETTTDATPASSASPEPIAEPPPPVASADPHPLAIAGFSVAAAGLVAFAVLGGITLSEDARLRGSCGHACSDADTSLIGATGIGADVSAGVALAGAILGVVGLVLPTGTSEAQVTAGPTGVAIRGSF